MDEGYPIILAVMAAAIPVLVWVLISNAAESAAQKTELDRLVQLKDNVPESFYELLLKENKVLRKRLTDSQEREWAFNYYKPGPKSVPHNPIEPTPMDEGKKPPRRRDYDNN